MSKIVTSLFATREEASAAVDRLVAAGFGTADISVLMAQETSARAVDLPGTQTGLETVHPHYDAEGRPRRIPLDDPGEDIGRNRTLAEDHHHAHLSREFGLEEHTKAPEGASAGAAVGGALGGILAGLAATGILLIPGVNLVAAGPVLAVLAGIGAGGTAGGLLGGLVGMGVPEHEAKLVDEGLRAGKILVGVLAHKDRVDLARKILHETGGVKVR